MNSDLVHKHSHTS